jgi:hypothetical protein
MVFDSDSKISGSHTDLMTKCIIACADTHMVKVWIHTAMQGKVLIHTGMQRNVSIHTAMQGKPPSRLRTVLPTVIYNILKHSNEQLLSCLLDVAQTQHAI